jgi:hypothetical protein
MTRGMRGLMLAAACGALAGGPALAFAQQPDPPKFTAYDTMPPVWRAGDGTTSVTIAPGGSVTFTYPSGSSFHNVTFTGAKPAACTGLPPQVEDGPPMAAGWSGSCRFDAAGSYAFICQYHPETMKATVVVADPDPGYGTPTPTPGTPGATPTPTPAVGPGGVTPPKPQSTLKGAVKLARTQRGSRLRGAVKVKGAKSRLEVSVWASRAQLAGGKSRKPMRVGRWLERSTRAGSVTFSVPLSARARNALRRHRRLPVTVAVALTPPGGHELTRTLRATLRPA